MKTQKLRDWLIALNMKIEVGRTISNGWHATAKFNYMSEIEERYRVDRSVQIMEKADAGAFGSGTGFGQSLDGAFADLAETLSGKFLRVEAGPYTQRSYMRLPIPRLTYSPGDVEDLY